jgi:hypothetical protein
MNRQTCLRLARPFVLLLLLAGVLFLGANNAAWATPAQSGLAAPTVPKRDEVLEFKNFTCPQQTLVAEFNVSNLGDNVTDYGTVSYVVNGQTRTAAFERRTGNTARYVDTIPPAQQSTNGVYSVSSGSVTITSGSSSKTLSLKNPGTFSARCSGPSNPPNAPGVPGSGQPGSGNQPIQSCADGAPQGAIGPGINATIANCPWIVFTNGGSLKGRIEIRPLSPNNLPPPNAGDAFTGPLADIVFIDESGNAVAHPTFSSPIQICYAYSAADLASVANNPSSLMMQFYDEASATWIVVPSAANLAAGRVCGTLNHLTKFAMAYHKPVPASLPNTGAGEASFGPWIWLAITLALLAGAGLRLAARRPARG